MKTITTLMASTLLAIGTAALAAPTDASKPGTGSSLKGQERAAAAKERRDPSLQLQGERNVLSGQPATPAVPATPADPATGISATPAIPATPSTSASVGSDTSLQGSASTSGFGPSSPQSLSGGAGASANGGTRSGR